MLCRVFQLGTFLEPRVTARNRNEKRLQKVVGIKNQTAEWHPGRFLSSKGRGLPENRCIKLLMYLWATSHKQTSRAGCRGLLRLLLSNLFISSFTLSQTLHTSLWSHNRLYPNVYIRGRGLQVPVSDGGVQYSGWKSLLSSKTPQKMSASTLLKWKMCNVSSVTTVKGESWEFWDVGWTDVTLDICKMDMRIY